MGGMVEFEFEFAYKIRVAAQRETLHILRISKLSCLLCMNREFFEDFLTSPMFDQYPESDRKLIHDITLGPGPAETASTRRAIASEGASPEVMSMEVLAAVLMMSRSPRLKPMPTREVPKLKKDKQKKPMLVHESPQKHAATQAQ